MINYIYCTACYGMGYIQNISDSVNVGSIEDMMKYVSRSLEKPRDKCYLCNGYGKVKIVPLTEEENEEVKKDILKGLYI